MTGGLAVVGPLRRLRERGPVLDEWVRLIADQKPPRIERYYVPEGEGRDIESARNDGRVSVAARVSTAGQASIRALMLDGKPLYEEPLY